MDIHKEKRWLSERSWLGDIGVIFFLSLAVASPLFNSHWIMVGESIEQLMRLIELDRGIREGLLYPRWFGDFAGGFGYPYFVFYAPLIYYVSEVFYLLGLGAVTSLKCMMVLGVILSGMGMYALARCFWGEKGALVSAIAYVFVPYRMVNLYIRGDFAEAFAMALLPWVLYFCYELVTKGRWGHLIGFVLSYGALILTHNCTALLFSGFLVLFLIFVSLRNKHRTGFFKGVLAMTWAMGLSAVFWVPALWEKAWVHIHLIYSDRALDFHNNFLQLFQLFQPTWSLEGGVGGRNLPFQIGWPHVLLALFSCLLLFGAEVKQVTRTLFFLLFCNLLAVFFTMEASLFLWETLPLMRYIQFPWRFLTVLSLFISLIAGGLFVYFAGTPQLIQKMFQIVLVIVIAVSGLQYCRVKGYYIMDENRLNPVFVRKDGGTVSACNTTGMSRVEDFGEYLPKWVKSLPNKGRAGRVFVIRGKAKVADRQEGIQSYAFTLDVEEPCEVVVGSFYYPRWKGRLGGESLRLFTNAEGLIHFEAPRGTHSIRIFFGGSEAGAWGKSVSFLSLMALFAYGFLNAVVLPRRHRRGGPLKSD
jgi:hypothetical protein